MSSTVVVAMTILRDETANRRSEHTPIAHLALFIGRG
jgi:hypothetical protein